MKLTDCREFFYTKQTELPFQIKGILFESLVPELDSTIRNSYEAIEKALVSHKQSTTERYDVLVHLLQAQGAHRSEILTRIQRDVERLAQSKEQEVTGRKVGADSPVTLYGSTSGEQQIRLACL